MHTYVEKPKRPYLKVTVEEFAFKISNIWRKNNWFMKKRFLDWELESHNHLSWCTLRFFVRRKSGNWPSENKNNFPFSEELFGKDWDEKWGNPSVCREMAREFDSLARDFAYNLRRYLGKQ